MVGGHVYYVKGNKKEVYAFVGYLFSLPIERVDKVYYQLVSEKLLADITEYYTVNDDGSIKITRKEYR